MSDYEPSSFRVDGFDVSFDAVNNTMRATESLEAIQRQFYKMLTAAKEERVKAALRALGWVSPEDARSMLNDHSDAFRMVWMLTRRAGGSIAMSELELLEVAPHAALRLEYDLATRNIVLTATTVPAKEDPTDA